MDNTNGIPFLWDNIQENDLLGSLFPEDNNLISFSSVLDKGNSSVFKNSPFGEFWNVKIHEWAKPEFGSAKILDKKNIIIADKSSKIPHNKADFYNDLINKDLSKYNFIVYSHPDGKKVIESYKLSKLNKEKPFEILVFIETDDGKFDFGKIVRVKFGNAVIEDLKDKYFEELPWNDNDAQDIAQEFIKRAWLTSVSIQTVNTVDKEKNSDGFKDLLVKAIQYEDDNQKFDDFSWLILILKGSEYVDINLPDWCFSLGKWFRERKYLEDKYWNGDLSSKDYTPAFMPDFIFSQKEEDREKSLKEIFNKPYNDLRDIVNDKINGKDPVSKILKQNINEKIDKCQELSDEYIEKLLAKIHIPEGFFQTILKHYHAYTLGFYNGILEFIAGICDLTAILLLICREELGFRMTDLLTEKFENFVNALYDNTLETLRKIWEKSIEIFDDFALWHEKFSVYNGKSYKIVKEIGEIIPDILTFVIPVLKASKASKATKLAKATEEVVEKTAKELTETEAKLIAKTAKEALESGKATQATKEAIQDVEEKIISQNPKEIKKIVDKEKIPKRKTPKKELKVFKKTLDLSKVLSNYADDALTKWKNPFTRPGAVAILEGEIKGKTYQAVSYSSKGIAKSIRVGRRHKLVQEWLEEIAEEGIKNRRNHGFCAEPVCISEFLFEAEKQLGLKANSMKIAQAREILSKTRSKALRIYNDPNSKLAHGLSKKACESCNPMLDYFRINEIFN